MPKWIGDAMETLMASKFLALNVTAADYLSPRVKRLRLEGDLGAAEYFPGYAVSFRVSNMDYRDYTPLYFDRVNGICDVVVHLHGNGPGSNFADQLQPGDRVKMVIPRGKKMYRPDVSRHFFFGDETSLGTAVALKRAAEENNQPYWGALELEEENYTVPGLLGLDAALADKRSGYKETALESAVDKFLVQGSDAAFYLTGNAYSIQVFRKILKDRGVKNSQMVTQAYWSPGKRGL